MSTTYNAAGEPVEWIADESARRVPLFVIEATGLQTKKAIVAKYGPNARFVKGQCHKTKPKGRP